jgi:hypothetical protein
LAYWHVTLLHVASAFGIVSWAKSLIRAGRIWMRPTSKDILQYSGRRGMGTMTPWAC